MMYARTKGMSSETKLIVLSVKGLEELLRMFSELLMISGISGL